MGIIAYFEFGYDCVEVDSNGIGKEGCFYLTQMKLNNLHVLNICKNGGNLAYNQVGDKGCCELKRGVWNSL